MKPFAIWLVGVLVLFGAFSYGYHQVRTGDPQQILVVVDVSQPMEEERVHIERTLDRLDNEKYAEFALATTQSGLIHSWADALEFGDESFYAPHNFKGLVSGTAYPELDEASEKILVTNAADTELVGLENWTIVRPG